MRWTAWLLWNIIPPPCSYNGGNCHELWREGSGEYKIHVYVVWVPVQCALPPLDSCKYVQYKPINWMSAWLDRNATIVFIFNFQDGNILGVTLLKLRLLALIWQEARKLEVNLFWRTWGLDILDPSKNYVVCNWESHGNYVETEGRRMFKSNRCQDGDRFAKLIKFHTDFTLNIRPAAIHFSRPPIVNVYHHHHHHQVPGQARGPVEWTLMKIK